MKRTLTVLLALLLLLALAVPALASHTGASEEDKTIWNTPYAANRGDPDKTLAVAGEDRGAAINARRAASGQTSRTVTVVIVSPDGAITVQTMSVEDFFALIDDDEDNTYYFGEGVGIYTYEVFRDLRDAGHTGYYIYLGSGQEFEGDPDAFINSADAQALPASMNVYTYDQYLSGAAATGDLYYGADGELYLKNESNGGAGDLVSGLYNNVILPPAE